MLQYFFKCSRRHLNAMRWSSGRQDESCGNCRAAAADAGGMDWVELGVLGGGYCWHNPFTSQHPFGLQSFHPCAGRTRNLCKLKRTPFRAIGNISVYFFLFLYSLSICLICCLLLCCAGATRERQQLLIVLLLLSFSLRFGVRPCGHKLPLIDGCIDNNRPPPTNLIKRSYLYILHTIFISMRP